MSANEQTGAADILSLYSQAEKIYQDSFPEFQPPQPSDEKDALIRELQIQKIALRLKIEALENDLDGARKSSVMPGSLYKDHVQEPTLEDVMAQAFEYAPIGIGLITIDSRWISVNKAFTNILGYTMKDLATMSSYDILHPDDLPKGKNGATRLLAGETPGYTRETRYIHKDGSCIYAFISASVIHRKDGTPAFFILQIMDMTKHKEAENALRQSEEKFVALFKKSALPAMLSLLPDFSIVDINDAWRDLLGYALPEVLGKTTVELGITRNVNRRSELAGEVIRKRHLSNVEIVYHTKSGKALTLLANISVITIAGAEFALTTYQDVTDQKKLQEEVIQAQKVQSIGTLAAGIAHDFNNILGIIIGYTSMLETRRLDERKHGEAIDIILKNIDRGRSLVQQIMTFARKTDIQYEMVEMRAFLREMIPMFQETFPKTITFRLDINNAVTYPPIMADRTQIQQAIMNLCVNARDAMPGGGTITLRLRLVNNIEIRRQFKNAVNDRYLCLSVIDTGHGMDEQTKLRIFDPFFTTKEKGKGTGLGLSVVYGIMESHQGFIDVTSETGVGSNFTLSFPVSDELISVNGSEARHDSGGELPKGNETILVVEDEPEMLEYLQTYLEKCGYHVLSAIDGDEAISMLATHQDEVALVISDLGLPKIGGEQAYLRMKDINPKVKAIFASGYFEPGLKERLMNAGGRGFVSKPYMPDVVLRLVRQVLDER
ncbi:MAG: PAS domain S-box protein [Acidobacteriota bacterium]